MTARYTPQHVCNHCGHQTPGVLEPGLKAAVDLLKAEIEHCRKALDRSIDKEDLLIRGTTGEMLDRANEMARVVAFLERKTERIIDASAA